jgi:hypothetical protein
MSRSCRDGFDEQRVGLPIKRDEGFYFCEQLRRDAMLPVVSVSTGRCEVRNGIKERSYVLIESPTQSPRQVTCLLVNCTAGARFNVLDYL